MEGWAAGTAEVRLAAYVNFYLNTYNQVVFNNLFVYQGGDPLYLGNNFSVGVQKAVDKRVIDSWKATNYFKDNQYPLNESNNQSTKVHYVIFEHDSWPVANRSHQFGNDAVVEYRSSDPFYTQGTWLASNGNYWSNFSGLEITNNYDRIECLLKVIP